MGKYCEIFRRNFSNWMVKCFTFSNRTCPPLPLPTVATLWCFSGAFITCFTWLLIIHIIRTKNPKSPLEENSYIEGSFGSFVAAQYLLFSSPAAQPWNAITSEIVCCTLVLLINQISGFTNDVTRTAFCTALIVATI